MTRALRLPATTEAAAATLAELLTEDGERVTSVSGRYVHLMPGVDPAAQALALGTYALDAGLALVEDVRSFVRAHESIQLRGQR